MNWRGASCLLAVAGGWPAPAGAQLQLLAAGEPQYVFAGAAQSVSLTWSNAADEPFAADIRAHVYQTTSATALELGDRWWKTLEVLPRQTVLESAPLEFPAVRAETRFLVQWLADTNRLLGATEVWVYPTNLLAELRLVAGVEPPGVFDPDNELKPLLKDARVPFVDLGEMTLAEFPGRLAIVGPFASRLELTPGLCQRVKLLAQHGASVVWLLPPPEPDSAPAPSFYTVREANRAVVVVQAELVTHLASRPQAQLNLIYFCKLALKPEPFALPHFNDQP